MTTSAYNFRTSQVKPQREFDRSPIPDGKYKFKLDLKKMEVSKSTKFPTNPGYVTGVWLKCLAEGPYKGKVVFHNLYLGMKPWKDGKFGPIHKGGQLADLAQALDEDLSIGEDPFNITDYEVQKVKRDSAGNETDEVETETQPHIDAVAVKEWLSAHDGTELEVAIRVANNTYQGKTTKKSEVDYFVLPTGNGETSGGDADLYSTSSGSDGELPLANEADVDGPLETESGSRKKKSRR